MSVTDKIKAYFEPKPNELRIRDVVRELPGAKRKVEKKVGELAVDIAQGTARAVASVGITAGNAPTQVVNNFFGKKVKNPFDSEISTQNSRVARAVFGETSIKDIPTYGKSGLAELDKLRAQIKGSEVEPTNPAFAVPLAGLGIVSELSGLGGPTKKAALKLGDEVVDLLSKTTKSDEVAKILKESTDLNEETIKTVAPKFAFAKTADDIRTVADEVVTKEQGFVTSVKEAIPAASKVNGQYIVRDTDELAIKARNLVETDEAAALNMARKSDKDDAVAVTAELLKKWSNDAISATDEVTKARIYDDITNLTTDMADRLTAAGRFVQAASILQRSTPEGQLRFAAKTIERYNKENPTRMIPGLTAEDSKFILEEMKAIEAMPDGWQKAARFQKVQEYTLDKIPTPLWKKMTTTWQAGLLTGIKTTGLNLASTTGNILAGSIAKIPATIVDSAVSLITGKRSVALSYGVTPKGLKEGWEKGVRFFKTGYDERQALDYRDFRRVNFGKGRVAKLFQGYTDTVFRFLGLQDQLFYYGVNAASLLEQAKIQAINSGRKGADRKAYQYFLSENPTEEMITAAAIDATTATFQNKTVLGKALSSVRTAGGPVGEIAIPFARTPAAVAMEVIRYSPIGFGEAVWVAMRKGEFDQKRFSTLVGKATTGTIPMAIGYNLMKEDLVALEYPTTPRERAKWEAEGRKPNTILINGKWRSPYVLGPNGVLILWGAHLKQAMEQTGSYSEAITQAAFGMGKSFLEQTATTGINSLAEALNNPGQYGQAYIANLVGSIVPTLVSDTARSIDPYERDSKGQGFIDSVSKKIQNRLPLARQALPIKVDAYGYNLKRVGNFMEVLADPTRPSKAVDSVTIREIHRLWEEGYKAAPTKLDYYPSLSPKQQGDLFRAAGTRIEDGLIVLMQRPSYRAASDEKKADMIDKVITQAKVDGRAIIVGEIMADIAPANRVKKLAELKKEGLLTEAVYARYKELY